MTGSIPASALANTRAASSSVKRGSSAGGGGSNANAAISVSARPGSPAMRCATPRADRHPASVIPSNTGSHATCCSRSACSASPKGSAGDSGANGCVRCATRNGSSPVAGSGVCRCRNGKSMVVRIFPSRTTRHTRRCAVGVTAFRVRPGKSCRVSACSQRDEYAEGLNTVQRDGPRQRYLAGASQYETAQ
ncbi:MAG: hypothetical protein BWY76_03135 [bacterium ADurb.Bin429]|nr:MAG: hypothetical protein BWY76_03135 [bacterium ADurb.Bin429]